MCDAKIPWVSQKGLIASCASLDGKVYDAYVIYQKDNVDEITGSKADYFVNKILPAVLEKDCGFKLYIDGRDDLPGEGAVELHYL